MTISLEIIFMAIADVFEKGRMFLNRRETPCLFRGRILYQACHCRKAKAYERDICYQQQTNQNCDIIAQHIWESFCQGSVADLDGNKQRVSNRRCDVANTEVVHQNQAKMNRMYPEGFNQGQEQRSEDQDGWRNIHKGTSYQQDHVHNQEDDNRVTGNSKKCGGHGLGNL